MHRNRDYILGVDAGGTFTDAVLVEADTGLVAASAKRPTTHYDVSLGIASALQAVMDASRVSPARVVRTCVSTTLATNTLVEGKGADVGLFVIGFNQRLEVPAVAARYIPGGHTVLGEEQEPLGVPYVLDGLAELHDHVDAWAVCGAMAFVNPAHELVVAKAIALTDTKPVFCSHEASSRAGMKERATTACLNAQLLPVMRDFLQGMRHALANLGITGNVLVVRGDAHAMHMDEALRHAASTVASGPAATALFGAHAAGNRDALIVDVGGTTTDVTMVRCGAPVVNDEGMTLGKWETHVTAVEMFTVGVGGDSLVLPVQDGSFTVGPERVQPICLAARKPTFPSPASWIGHGPNARCLLAAPGTGATDIAHGGLLSFLAEHGPATPGQVLEALSMAGITFETQLAQLVRAQCVMEAGFTPTDALHVLGQQNFGDTRYATEAATILGALRGMDAQEFAHTVLAEAEQRIEDAVLHHVAQREWGDAPAAWLNRRRTKNDGEPSLISVDISLNVPIIGIGAAARHLLPGVARSLRADIVFPEGYEVGNAVGAARMAME